MLLVWVVTSVTFVLSRVIPGDPATFIAGLNASQTQIESIRESMGLNDPLPEQYVSYFADLAQGELGESVRTRFEVADDLRQYLPATLELIAFSFTIYVALSLFLGTLAAVRRGGRLDRFLRVGSTFGSGIPVFWLALVLQLIFFSYLHILPLSGRLGIREVAPPRVTGFFTVDSLVSGDFDLFLSAARHLVLPTVSIVLAMMAVGLRLTRSSVIAELGQPYITTAKAKGVPRSRIVRHHVMRNALNVVVTNFGIQLGYLFSWIILVETIFQWPGIGLYAFRSFQGLDYAPIMGLTIVISIMFVAINLVVDLIYPLLDPRLKTI